MYPVDRFQPPSAIPALRELSAGPCSGHCPGHCIAHAATADKRAASRDMPCDPWRVNDEDVRSVFHDPSCAPASANASTSRELQSTERVRSSQRLRSAGLVRRSFGLGCRRAPGMKRMYSKRVGMPRPVRFQDPPMRQFTNMRKPDRSSHTTYAIAHSAQRTSACSSTVWVACSCLSGG